VTVTRAAIWGIAALAGASLSQLSLIHAQTSSQAPASGATGQLPKPLISSGESAGGEAASPSNDGSAAVSEKAAIVNTTSEDKPGGATAPNAATAQNTPSADSPAQLTPSDPAPAGSSAAPQPATRTDAEPAPSTPAEIQAAKPEPEPVKIDPKDVKLTIATWSGAYGEAQQRVMIDPFAKSTGYDVKTVTYDGAYETLERQKDEPEWNVVDLNGAEMVRACNDGLLERLDGNFLKAAKDGGDPSQDFLPGAIHECGIGSMAWSAVLVTDQRLEHKPTSLQNFFDTANFPGKRILPKQPRYSLELALIADGVAPETVYDVLNTPQGQDRAFAKLSSIKDDIIWWEDPADVLGRIVNNEAIMGLAFNGRAFMSIVASEQPLEIIWDHQIYTYDYWSIPRGAEFQDAAREFIGFATSPDSLAAQASWLPYGPSRRSAAGSVANHPELGIDMKPFLPTHPEHFANALAMNDGFWVQNGAVLEARFAEWVEGRQLPTQKNALHLP
jgi:putative spermidine/putrescine transport system substrate-binding protein